MTGTAEFIPQYLGSQDINADADDVTAGARPELMGERRGDPARFAERITSLRFYGTNHAAVALAERARIFTIGSAACDVVVPRDLAGDVAPVHATIERVEGAIRISDQVSRHGLYRRPRSPRVAELLLNAGAVGWVGGCAVMALDPDLEALRLRLAWSVGIDAHLAVDEALAAVVDGVPLALVGARNLDAVALARAIHHAGADRERAFVSCEGTEIPPIEGFTGTLVVDLDRVRRFAASQVATMFAAQCGARVILLANDERGLRRHLDTYTERVRSIALMPLGRRPQELERLLQAIWSDELRTARRVEHLDRRALAGMAAHDWRGNFDELRAMAVRLLAYVEHRSLRRAAQSLGVRHQTLSRHLNRIGVPVVDQADRDLARPLAAPERSRPHRRPDPL